MGAFTLRIWNKPIKLRNHLVFHSVRSSLFSSGLEPQFNIFSLTHHCNPLFHDAIWIKDFKYSLKEGPLPNYFHNPSFQIQPHGCFYFTNLEQTNSLEILFVTSFNPKQLIHARIITSYLRTFLWFLACNHVFHVAIWTKALQFDLERGPLLNFSIFIRSRFNPIGVFTLRIWNEQTSKTIKLMLVWKKFKDWISLATYMWSNVATLYSA